MLRGKASGNDQRQDVGDNSTAYQVAGDLHINEGADFEIIRKLVMDLFNANAYDLTRTAGDIARARAEEVAEKYLDRMQKEAAESIQSLSQPDMQYALISAQKAYARAGDDNLADVLVDILVDRSKENQRNLMQVVYNESLEVAPKLTASQFDLLSLIFLLRHVKKGGIFGPSDFLGYLKAGVLSLGIQPARNDAVYTHLQYAGCGRLELTSVQLEEIFLEQYPQAFVRPLSSTDLEFLLNPVRGIRGVDDLIARGLIRRINAIDGTMVDSAERFEFIAVSASDLRSRLFMAGYGNEIGERAASFFERLPANEATQLLTTADSRIGQLISAWNNGHAKSFVLSSVGIAIAHANIRRKTGWNFDLTIWINES